VQLNGTTRETPEIEQMTSLHVEKAFEDAIEATLLASGGWKQGDPADFNAELALVPKDLFAFIRDTQPDLWKTLASQHKGDLEGSLLDALTKHLEMKGTLDVLRHGFKFFGKRTLGYRSGGRWGDAATQCPARALRGPRARPRSSMRWSGKPSLGLRVVREAPVEAVPPHPTGKQGKEGPGSEARRHRPGTRTSGCPANGS
jgi:hypothetical protein